MVKGNTTHKAVADLKHNHDAIQLSKQLQAEKNRVNQLKAAMAKNQSTQGQRGAAKSRIREHALIATSLSSAVARAVALPLTYTARVPDPWDEREVAVANPFTIFEDEFKEAAGDEALLGSGISVYGVSRDPLRFLMVPRRNKGSAWNYLFNWVITSIGPEVIGPATRLDLNQLTQSQDLEFAYLATMGSVEAYGPKQYPACDDNYNWIWIDGKDVGGTGGHNSSVTFLVFNTPAYPGGTLQVAQPDTFGEVWPLGATEPIRAELINSGTALGRIPILASGYYRLSYSALTSPTVGLYLQVMVSGTCDTFEFMPIPGFVERQKELSEVRMVGVSLMVSPTSSALAEGGIICGLQIPEREVPTTYLNLPVLTAPTSSGLSGLLNTRHSKSLNFKDGMYGWHKPTCENDLSFMCPFVYNALANTVGVGWDQPGATQTVSYRGHLYPPGGWLMIGVAGAPNPTTGTEYPGCIVKVTAAASLNFDTESLWYHVEQSTSDVSLLEIRKSLDGVPQFTENPFHVSDITNWISKNAGTMKNLAKAGLTALTGALVPEATPVVAALNTLY